MYILDMAERVVESVGLFRTRLYSMGGWSLDSCTMWYPWRGDTTAKLTYDGQNGRNCERGDFLN